MSTSLPDDQVQKIMTAVFAGQKIEAIKLYRQATNTGLREAKEFVEALQSRLWEESPERFTVAPGKSGCAKSAAAFLIAVTMIYIVAQKLLG